MSLIYEKDLDNECFSRADINRYFIGSITPQGHRLPVVVGGARLVKSAKEAGPEVIVYDTTGMIDQA